MSLKEVVGNIKDLYQLDQSKWERQVTGLEPVELLRELNSNRKILSINRRLAQMEAMGLVLGIVIGAGNNSPEVTFGSAGAIVATFFLHGRPGLVLEDRIKFINSETSSRRDRAIFYQDIETLNALDSLKITPP